MWGACLPGAVGLRGLFAIVEEDECALMWTESALNMR